MAENVKTNLGLVTHAERALREGWYYMWGTFGQLATKAFVESKIKQYPEQNEKWRSYVEKAVNKTRVCDCYGLVKGFLWSDEKGEPGSYNGAQDRNTNAAFSAAIQKGELSSLPEIPGVILYKPGHVGVYCGGGRFIEMQGSGVGAAEGCIESGKIFKGSKFTHWFLDTFVTYNGTLPDVAVRNLTLYEFAGEKYVKLLDLFELATGTKL